jgi:hypothetical protein
MPMLSSGRGELSGISMVVISASRMASQIEAASSGRTPRFPPMAA